MLAVAEVAEGSASSSGGSASSSGGSASSSGGSASSSGGSASSSGGSASSSGGSASSSGGSASSSGGSASSSGGSASSSGGSASSSGGSASSSGGSASLSGNCARTGTALTFVGTTLSPHASVSTAPSNNTLIGRFDAISASESATTTATGSAMSLSATFPVVGGSNPPNQLVILNLNVTSTGVQCIPPANTTVRFMVRGAATYIAGGILTARNTGVNTGCEINITQAATASGQIAKAEILNCILTDRTFSFHVFSGKFDLTVP